MHVVMLAFPDMTQLDLTGPFEVFARFKELQLHIVSKTLDAVRDSRGLQIMPSATFADCPQADILFVPGGPGQLALMSDEQTLSFVKMQAVGARWITAVCTGSLILAAAGLLTGYRATCHWLSLQQLAHFGCAPVSERVVIDRNRVTGAGVTSGIDFALTLTAEIFGNDRAKLVQLLMEYDPQPPFDSGSPVKCDPQVIDRVRGFAAKFQNERDQASRDAAARLNV